MASQGRGAGGVLGCFGSGRWFKWNHSARPCIRMAARVYLDAEMSRLILRYLARAFVVDPKIDIRMETYMQLATALGDATLLPRQMAELTPLGTVQRLALATPRGDRVILITGDSVDIQYSPTLPSMQDSMTFRTFCDGASTQLADALKFLGAKAHRLAAVQEILIHGIDPAHLEESGRKLLVIPSKLTNSENRVIEWDWRWAVEAQHTMAHGSELSHKIATVKRVVASLMSTAQSVKGLFIALDTNTSPSNTTPRFERSEIVQYFQLAPHWQAEVEEDLLALLGIS